MRFEPSCKKPVILCSIGGERLVKGCNALTDFALSKLETDISENIFRGFGYAPAPDCVPFFKVVDMSREDYASMYGPTVGDRIRLGDTSLWVQIERDSVSWIITWVRLTV